MTKGKHPNKIRNSPKVGKGPVNSNETFLQMSYFPVPGLSGYCSLSGSCIKTTVLPRAEMATASVKNSLSLNEKFILQVTTPQTAEMVTVTRV